MVLVSTSATVILIDKDKPEKPSTPVEPKQPVCQEVIVYDYVECAYE
jgi:hypothetical protein